MFLMSLYHLNIMYSAIDIERREEVINNCYWPLLDLCNDPTVKIALEMPAYTLEVINQLEPSWVKALKTLLEDRQVELISCGYSQLIAPLVPLDVNLQNLQIGQRIYSDLLGYAPKIGLINEQALSAGALDSFIDCDFEAVIMEYNNIALDEHNWVKGAEKRPQYLRAASGRTIPVIWNDSINFQKFQRFAHRDLSLDDYMRYFTEKTADFQENDIFIIYGNDVEIFDFRPGRYMTEARLDKLDEWQRIRQLYTTLSKHKHVFPSESLLYSQENHVFQLNSIKHPVRVKKQPKYNILRWSVSGIDDVNINAKCYRLYRAIKDKPFNLDSWKKLCYFWSSDFRTHITKKRWNSYCDQLDTELDALGDPVPKKHSNNMPVQCGYTHTDRIYNFIGKRLNIKFDCWKGISINSFHDNYVSEEALFGKVEHGEIDKITHSADFFSGNLTLEVPGNHKKTDLIKTEPTIIHKANETELYFCKDSDFGNIKKKWIIRDENGELELQQTIEFNKGPVRGSIRLGTLTFLTGVTKIGTHLRSNLGGDNETFVIKCDTHHDTPVSSLISANQGLPVTEGTLLYYGEDFALQISLDMDLAAGIALCHFDRLANRDFHRIHFSVSECDDTNKSETREINFRMVIKARNQI